MQVMKQLDGIYSPTITNLTVGVFVFFFDDQSIL